MQPSLIRRQLGGLVPPKIATPSALVSVPFHARANDACASAPAR